MAHRVVIDPITRIEGHMKIEASVEGGKVVDAKSSGTLFRGFEIILQGREPRDAQRITQRVCGVCPTVHATASTLNLDSAFGIADKIPDNGRILRNLVLGSNYLQSHILHFYHLAALD
ncbi:MAG: nickel-dependent hydrogenase large subunit, partial [Spirochaetes bacterium]